MRLEQSLDKPLEIKINKQLDLISESQICNRCNMIPLQVVEDIIMVYEFGNPKYLDDLPNNLICKRDGNFWTTWDYVLSLRNKIVEIRRQNAQS